MPTTDAATASAQLPDVDLNAVLPCQGYWLGDDIEHTQHTPCPHAAQWAGRSDHDHAKTTFRCMTHRLMVDLSIAHDLMFCLTCKGQIRVMKWREL